MSVLALIPARSGSKGIPNKNFRKLGRWPLYWHAVEAAWGAVDLLGGEFSVSDRVIVSSDLEKQRAPRGTMVCADWLQRPPDLASDTTAMVDVVKHALSETPGQPDDIWILLQPTAPLRRPEHVQQAVRLLQESGADSVVSVVPLPLTHHADAQLEIAYNGTLVGYGEFAEFPGSRNRQEREPQTYIRDGTVYAFRRATVERYGTIYGQHVRPLLIDPADSCELDTMLQWEDVERRWKERYG